MTQKQIDEALYRVFGVKPYPQQPAPDSRIIQANNAVTSYQTINGAPVSFETNYGQQPTQQPPVEP